MGNQLAFQVQDQGVGHLRRSRPVLHIYHTYGLLSLPCTSTIPMACYPCLAPIPMACCPCLASSKHHAVHTGNADLIKLYRVIAAGDSQLDLGHAPYVLHGVKYIDLVSLTPSLPSPVPHKRASLRHLRFGLKHAPIWFVWR